MNRKVFLQQLFAAGTTLTLYPYQSLSNTNTLPSPERFSLNYAPHFGMFSESGGESLEAQLRFIAKQGFRALEDNRMKERTVETQLSIAQLMDELDLQMGVFVGHTIGWREPNLTTDDKELHLLFLKEMKESISVAKRVNARWITVVPGHVDRRLKMEYQTANVIDTLKRAAELLEPHDLTMVLEPLNTLRDHPGQFLTEIAQAYQICKAVDSPSCKILFDIYHQQITEGNLIPNLDYAWDEIGYIQVGDHPGRNEPLTGEINYRNIFQHLYEKGYEGIIGMEHGNSIPGKKGEQAVIEAYRACDPG